MANFDRKTWARFSAVAKPFFVSELKWKARGMLLLLVACSVTVSYVNVRISYVNRDFMTALSLKQKEEFFRQLWRYLFVFLAATPVVVFYQYIEQRLGLMWRRWLSLALIDKYFGNLAYYRITGEASVDNPDQRLVEDVRSFTTLTLSFLVIILSSVIQLYAFMWILWSISPRLLYVAIGYAALGSIFTYLLGRPLIGLNFSQLKKDADYRYKLVNVRDNAESIAFYRGEKKERTRVRQKLKDAIKNFRRIVDWNRNLGFFTTGYNYVVQILPTVVVAPLYLDGTIEFGVVTQAGFAFSQVLGGLSIIVLNFGGLSTFAAVISRLGGFSDVVSAAPLPPTCIELKTGLPMSFDRVTVFTPTRRRAVASDVSFVVPRGAALLISGPSGSGKSSLLRTFAGLWRDGKGVVTRPRPEDTIFLPQRPYMVMGTFRSQLLYALRRAALTDAELTEALDRVALLPTLERVGGFDSVLDWPSILSTGEQQRLAFARLLLVRPRYAFLDEATTALDASVEEGLYAMLPEVTEGYVSIGHRSRLGEYHQAFLESDGRGGWRFSGGTGEGVGGRPGEGTGSGGGDAS